MLNVVELLLCGIACLSACVVQVCGGDSVCGLVCDTVCSFFGGVHVCVCVLYKCDCVLGV